MFAQCSAHQRPSCAPFAFALGRSALGLFMGGRLCVGTCPPSRPAMGAVGAPAASRDVTAGLSTHHDRGGVAAAMRRHSIRFAD